MPSDTTMQSDTATIANTTHWLRLITFLLLADNRRWTVDRQNYLRSTVHRLLSVHCRFARGENRGCLQGCQAGARAAAFAKAERMAAIKAGHTGQVARHDLVQVGLTWR